MRQERYWVTVVSKDHIKRGVAGGFMQANHGKPGALKKLHPNDWVIFYSPKMTYAGDEKLQAFTAIGQVADDNIYQHKMSEDFVPYRRNITYYPCKDAPIVPLIGSLDFITDKKSWGYRFRFGFFEIDEHDFNLLKNKMFSPADRLSIEP
ncbi:MAG: EVE domain-containing protein [Bacteroidetes bacterium]|nr:EVE domain-containing protein [Bacteroidota bacterium]